MTFPNWALPKATLVVVAAVVAMVVLSVVEVVDEEPLSLLLLQEMKMKLKRDISVMRKNLFIFHLARNEHKKLRCVEFKP